MCLFYIFYIPANVLPITIVISLGKAQSDTIMGFDPRLIWDTQEVIHE